MRVDPEKPHKLIYSLLEHAQLGYVIEPFVVQLNEQNHLTFTHQRIFTKTCELFADVIDKKDLEILKILDEFDNEYITRRFYKEKKKIRPTEFFQKHCTNELIQNHIKPFIERRLEKVLPMLVNKPLYLQGLGNNPAAYPIKISSEPSTVLFHFRKNNEDTRYFATIRHAGEKIDFMQNNAVIICNEPAWMLLNRTLYHFTKDFDGKKLSPFINKKFILVPKSAEEKFYSSFVTKVIEKFDVYPEGFQIETVSNQFRSSLHMQQKLDGSYHLTLFFDYVLDTVHYLSSRDVMVKLDYSPENVHFRRLRRNHRKELQIVKLLIELGLHENHENGFELPVNDLYALIQWVAAHTDVLKEHGIRIEQNEQNKKFVIAPSEVSMDISQVNDWFDVHATVTFGAFQIPFIRLKNHILKNINEFALPDGSTAIIPPEWFTRFAAMFALNEGNEEEIKIRAYHYGVIEQMQADEKSGIHNPFALKEDKIIEPVALPDHLNATLRPYQRQGFYWFYFLQKHRIGGILADDMGLGKTLQTLTLLQKEKELFPAYMPEDETPDEAEIASPVPAQQENNTASGARTNPVQLDLFATTAHTPAVQPIKETTTLTGKKPGNKTLRRTSLIIVPSSLVYNWYSEAKKFTPGLRLFIHSGNQRVKSLQLFAQYDVVVTTYGVLRKDIGLFKEAFFHYIILDEGQAIKNASSLVAQSVYQLQSRFKLVLTGTPVENTLRDLWSQLHFLNPDFLGTQQSFQHQYAIPIEKNQHYVKLEELKAITRPFLLRRTKELVAPDLPDKTEFTVSCDMTEEQREFYEKIKSQYRNEIIKSITEDGFAKSKLQVLTGLMKLRQVANHPGLHDATFRGESGKFNDIVSKVESVISENHKVLLFSQFTSYLALFRKAFDEMGISYAYLDGSLTSEQRSHEVNRFQKEEGIRVFLISLKAGGVGLNLTAADYVFLADPWWNPAVEEQAMSRAHRIGQDKKVFVYKFISRDTLEEKIIGLQQRKSFLAKEITGGEEDVFRFMDEEEVKALFE